MARMSTERLKAVFRKGDAEDDSEHHELLELTARVRDLEDQVQECRRHHHRLAELTDVVQELLVPISQRDQESVEEILERYTDQLG